MTRRSFCTFESIARFERIAGLYTSLSAGAPAGSALLSEIHEDARSIARRRQAGPPTGRTRFAEMDDRGAASSRRSSSATRASR